MPAASEAGMDAGLASRTGPLSLPFITLLLPQAALVRHNLLLQISISMPSESARFFPRNAL